MGSPANRLREPRSRRRLRHLGVAVPAAVLMAAVVMTASALGAITAYREGTTATGTCATPSNALTNGGGSAVCDPVGETIVVSGFDLQSVVPSGSTAIGFNVEVDADDDNDGGHADVALSWDGGSTWTASQDSLDFDSNSDVLRTVPTTSATDCTAFGREWSWSELADASFRVQVTAEGENLDVDRIRVLVCSTEPESSTPPSGSPSGSPTASATAGASGGAGSATPPPTGTRPVGSADLGEVWIPVLLMLGAVGIAVATIVPAKARRPR